MKVFRNSLLFLVVHLFLCMSFELTAAAPRRYPITTSQELYQSLYALLANCTDGVDIRGLVPNWDIAERARIELDVDRRAHKTARELAQVWNDYARLVQEDYREKGLELDDALFEFIDPLPEEEAAAVASPVAPEREALRVRSSAEISKIYERFSRERIVLVEPELNNFYEFMRDISAMDKDIVALPAETQDQLRTLANNFSSGPKVARPEFIRVSEMPFINYASYDIPPVKRTEEARIENLSLAMRSVVGMSDSLSVIRLFSIKQWLEWGFTNEEFLKAVVQDFVYFAAHNQGMLNLFKATLNTFIKVLCANELLGADDAIEYFLEQLNKVLARASDKEDKSAILEALDNYKRNIIRLRALRIKAILEGEAARLAYEQRQRELAQEAARQRMSLKDAAFDLLRANEESLKSWSFWYDQVFVLLGLEKSEWELSFKQAMEDGLNPLSQNLSGISARLALRDDAAELSIEALGNIFEELKKLQQNIPQVRDALFFDQVRRFVDFVYLKSIDELLADVGKWSSRLQKEMSGDEEFKRLVEVAIEEMNKVVADQQSQKGTPDGSLFALCDAAKNFSEVGELIGFLIGSGETPFNQRVMRLKETAAESIFAIYKATDEQISQLRLERAQRLAREAQEREDAEASRIAALELEKAEERRELVKKRWALVRAKAKILGAQQKAIAQVNGFCLRVALSKDALIERIRTIGVELEQDSQLAVAREGSLVEQASTALIELADQFNELVDGHITEIKQVKELGPLADIEGVARGEFAARKLQLQSTFDNYVAQIRQRIHALRQSQADAVKQRLLGEQVVKKLKENVVRKKLAREALADKQRGAATKIQSAARMNAAQKRVKGMRRQAAADQRKKEVARAGLIQRIWRGFKGRQVATEKRADARDAAATTIQSNFRRYSTEKQYKKAKKAVVALQSNFRRRVAQRLVMEKRLDKLVDALEIREQAKREFFAYQRSTDNFIESIGQRSAMRDELQKSLDQYFKACRRDLLVGISDFIADDREAQAAFKKLENRLLELFRLGKEKIAGAGVYELGKDEIFDSERAAAARDSIQAAYDQGLRDLDQEILRSLREWFVQYFVSYVMRTFEFVEGDEGETTFSTLRKLCDQLAVAGFGPFVNRIMPVVTQAEGFNDYMHAQLVAQQSLPDFVAKMRVLIIEQKAIIPVFEKVSEIVSLLAQTQDIWRELIDDVKDELGASSEALGTLRQAIDSSLQDIRALVDDTDLDSLKYSDLEKMIREKSELINTIINRFITEGLLLAGKSLDKLALLQKKEEALSDYEARRVGVGQARVDDLQAKTEARDANFTPRKVRGSFLVPISKATVQDLPRLKEFDEQEAKRKADVARELAVLKGEARERRLASEKALAKQKAEERMELVAEESRRLADVRADQIQERKEQRRKARKKEQDTVSYLRQFQNRRGEMHAATPKAQKLVDTIMRRQAKKDESAQAALAAGVKSAKVVVPVVLSDRTGDLRSSGGEVSRANLGDGSFSYESTSGREAWKGLRQARDRRLEESIDDKIMQMRSLSEEVQALAGDDAGRIDAKKCLDLLDQAERLARNEIVDSNGRPLGRTVVAQQVTILFERIRSIHARFAVNAQKVRDELVRAIILADQDLGQKVVELSRKNRTSVTKESYLPGMYHEVLLIVQKKGAVDLPLSRLSSLDRALKSTLAKINGELTVQEAAPVRILKATTHGVADAVELSRAQTASRVLRERAALSSVSSELAAISMKKTRLIPFVQFLKMLCKEKKALQEALAYLRTQMQCIKTLKSADNSAVDTQNVVIAILDLLIEQAPPHKDGWFNDSCDFRILFVGQDAAVKDLVGEQVYRILMRLSIDSLAELDAYKLNLPEIAVQPQGVQEAVVAAARSSSAKPDAARSSSVVASSVSVTSSERSLSVEAEVFVEKLKGLELKSNADFGKFLGQLANDPRMKAKGRTDTDKIKYVVSTILVSLKGEALGIVAQCLREGIAVGAILSNLRPGNFVGDQKAAYQSIKFIFDQVKTPEASVDALLGV